VATSSGQRLLRYLYSNKNLVGSAGGLVGLALYFTGVVGDLWPVVVGGLYGVGALATPPTRTFDLHSGLDAANLNRAMATQERRLRSRVPDDVLAAVGRVHGQVREVLERRHALPPGSQDAFVVERTALDYVPTALESYLNLPRGYANRVPVSNGRTPARSSSTSSPSSNPSSARSSKPSPRATPTASSPTAASSKTASPPPNWTSAAAGSRCVSRGGC
jgi:hypothetical protein